MTMSLNMLARRTDRAGTMAFEADRLSRQTRGCTVMRLRQRVLAAVAGQPARPHGVVGRGAAILSTAVPVWVPR
jgi:hypothetical protein